MIFAGQYDDLRVLQPYVGHLYLNLLLDTPQWFPDGRRPLLVPALRDLYPDSPGEDAVQAIREIAEEEGLEAWNLRLALFCALAQWGDRELIDARIREVEGELETGDVEDRLDATRTLAQTYYTLRDHVAAARWHRQFLRGAEESGFKLVPADYYNAACCMSLNGDLESSLNELERCVELMRSGTVDSSLMLERDLFERDPEIAGVRKTARFAALLKAAFPDGDSPEEPGK